MNARDFYAAGRAIALAEIGRPSGLPIVQDDGSDLLPIMTGVAAAERASKTGAIKYKRRELEGLISGALIELTRSIRAFANQTSDDNARSVGDMMNERAGQLIVWKWHSIKRLAEAISSQRSLSDGDIKVLLGA